MGLVLADPYRAATCQAGHRRPYLDLHRISCRDASSALRTGLCLYWMNYHMPPGEALRSYTLIRSKYCSALSAAVAIAPESFVRLILNKKPGDGMLTSSTGSYDSHRSHGHYA